MKSSTLKKVKINSSPIYNPTLKSSRLRAELEDRVSKSPLHRILRHYEKADTFCEISKSSEEVTEK